METFEVGVKCVWTGHTFSSGEQARKCLNPNCPYVMRISAWQEKGRCFCGSTNTVEAIATTNNPTILTTNSRQNSRTSGTSNTRRTSLNWRDTTSANSSVNSSNNPYSIDNSSAFPKWLGYIFGVGVFLFFLISVTLHKFDRESPDTFVKKYYSLVNNRQYSSAWNHLSDFFKNKTSVNEKGYSSYLKYWKTVKRVEILRTRVESSYEKSATVNIQMRYYMISKNKTVDESLRLFLVWDTKNSRWAINNTEYSN